MSNGECSAPEIWQAVSRYIRAKSEDAYRQWFKQMVPISVDGKQIVLGTSDRFFATWVMNNYGDILADALAAAGCEGFEVTFEYGYGLDGTGVDPDYSKVSVEPRETENTLISAELSSLIRKQSFENFVVGEENRYA